MLSRLRVSDWSVVECIAAASLARGSNSDSLPAGVFAVFVADAVRRADLAVLVRGHSDSSLSVCVAGFSHVLRLARVAHARLAALASFHDASGSVYLRAKS